MGEIVRPDQALSIEILLKVFEALEEEWWDPRTDNLELAMEGAFYIVVYCCPLQGEEAPLTDLYGIRAHWEEGLAHTTKHITIALLGHFKSETGESYHLLPIIKVTNHGLNLHKWIGHLLTIYTEKGLHHGPFFCNTDDTRRMASSFEAKFAERLK